MVAVVHVDGGCGGTGGGCRSRFTCGWWFGIRELSSQVFTDHNISSFSALAQWAMSVLIQEMLIGYWNLC